MNREKFIDVLKSLVGSYYRKSSSGVVREDPFSKIANDAERIHHNLKRGSDAWKAIKKDQNAHIGLILQDYFGDLGIAQTDATKLFRMLLSEGRDPRVTGKKPAATLPTSGNTGIADPVKSGKAAPGTTISPGDLLSETQIKNFADNIVKKWDTQDTGWSIDFLGHRFYLAPNLTNPNFADLTVRKKNASGPAFGPPQIIKTVLLSGGKTKAQVIQAIQDFQDNLTIFTPTDAPSGQYFIGGKTFVPNQKQSAPTNLNKFVEALFNAPNGLKLGNVTVLNAGTKQITSGIQAMVIKVYEGDSVAASNLKTEVEIPLGMGKGDTVSAAKRDIVDWLSDYGMMQAKQSGYTSLMGWMAQDLSKSMKPTMTKGVKDILKKLENSTKPGNAAGNAAKNYLNYAIDLTDMEFVDANLGNLPPNGFDAAVKFTENILGPGSKELTSGEIFDLAEFLWQTGKWAAKKLEDRKEAQMKEDDAAEMEDQPTGDEDPIAPGYKDTNGNPMTASAVAATIQPFEPGSNENHVFFTTNSGTAIQNPYEDETGNPIENPPIGPTEEGLIMKYWADQGVLPNVSEAALVIFDKANPGHTYKPDTKLWDTPGLKAKIDALGMNFENVIYDGGIPDTIEVSTKNGGIKITKSGPGEYTYQGDAQNFAVGPLDYVLKAVSEYLKKPSQAAQNENKAKAQAMEFLDNMLLDDPVKIGDNVWELESIEDDNGESVAAVVKLNGIAVSNQIPLTENMSIDAPPKAVYDSYFALDWMKDWKAPKPFKKFADPNAKPAEPGSLLTPSQDQMMQAATELITELSNEYVLESKVTIGNKNFSAKINEQGNMVVFAQDENGYLTGAYPIQGSKNMDPIDLEAAVYEALDVLGAGFGKIAETPKATKITPQMINEAADALMNDETASLGKYTFEPIASGLGGTRVNIYVEPGMDDPVSYFLLDPGEYREPSDMLDAFYDKISEFLDNNPEFDDGTGGAGPGAQMMPAEARGAFYHGTDKRRSTRLGPRGGEFYGQWEGDAVRVTYLSPEFEEAERFGENVLEGRLKNRNIFDPTDEEDIERVVRTALELGPDTSAIVEEAKTDPEAAKELKFIEKGIRRDIAGGKDKRDGWRSVESYAGAIKAAGFDGYVAWEGGYAAVGAFPDRIDLREFETDKFGVETYDRYPKGSVRSRGSGNIQYMPAGSPMRAAAIRVGDKIFEGPMHMMVLDEIRKDQDIMGMFKNDDKFDEAMRDSDLIDSMDFMELSMDPPSEMKPRPRPLPAGLAQKVTFGFVDTDGKFHNRRDAMKIAYGGELEGPLFSEDLPPDSPASKYLHANFMPAAMLNVPTQKTLDRLKKRLPKYEVEIEGPDEKDDLEVRILLPKGVRGRGGDLMSRAYGSRVVGMASVQLEPEDAQDAIEVFGSSVRPAYRGKGYGEALYREIAKIAQKNKKRYIYGSSVSEDAARVRGKLFREEKTMDGPWEKSGNLMLSRVGPSIQYMPGNAPGSSQVDPGLAGVTVPDVDRGPLSGAQFMPGYNPRYTDDDGNFDFGLYSEDKRKTIAYLRDRMGITRKDFPNDEEWKRIIRETMRDVIRGG